MQLRQNPRITPTFHRAPRAALSCGLQLPRPLSFPSLNCAPSGGLNEVDLAGRPKGKASTRLRLSPWQIRTVRIDVPTNSGSVS